ncbi:hypothetical protein [Photobacterium kishitanii]|uniref:Sel1 repeat family protein n=1 Tax=Photobacterium kishitanii TaxID=318456 RepID=A0A2T3KL86_9GAMM|nr:hypothetical protein [Photobacterium kishitanii]PSV00419.1 hypothetical protein C9J27_04625 [Photobacterium kishitanii]
MSNPEYTIAQILQLDKKAQPLAYRTLAASGDPEASLAYSDLVFRDKYKGEAQEGSKITDAEKKKARQEAIDYLLQAAENGCPDCAVKGANATFRGIRGATFNKVLCKTSYSTCIQFLDNYLSHHSLSKQDEAKHIYMKAMAQKYSQVDKLTVIKTLNSVADLEGTHYSTRAKGILGRYAYDSGDYESAIPLLKSDTCLPNAVLLTLIFKNHIKDTREYNIYRTQTLDLLKNKESPERQL